jgi:hypothetical protein
LPGWGWVFAKPFMITLRSNVPTIRVPNLSKWWALMFRELFIKVLISFMNVMSKVRLKMSEHIVDASNGINLKIREIYISHGGGWVFTKSFMITLR